MRQQRHSTGKLVFRQVCNLQSAHVDNPLFSSSLRKNWTPLPSIKWSGLHSSPALTVGKLAQISLFSDNRLIWQPFVGFRIHLPGWTGIYWNLIGYHHTTLSLYNHVAQCTSRDQKSRLTIFSAFSFLIMAGVLQLAKNKHIIPFLKSVPDNRAQNNSLAFYRAGKQRESINLWNMISVNYLSWSLLYCK